MSFFNSKNKRLNVERMDVIEPKRLKSLESFTIKLLEHSVFTKAPGSASLKINGFTTVADLKRQIWIQHQGNPEWSPNRIWVAQELNGLFKPIDMSWDEYPEFEDGIPTPSDSPGQPDDRLVDGNGNRKPVYPVINEGLLLESVFPDMNNLPTLHVYTLESLVRAIGRKLENPAVLHGYIQMYFPKIQSTKEAIETKDESYKQAAEYIKQRSDRVASIDALLHDDRVTKSEPFRLRHLRRWKAIIPPHHEDKSLDILFYEFHTSEHVPFLRFFPARGRSAPLLKLASGPTGFPLISDKDMLATFLDEEPNTELGAVLVAKIPFDVLSSEVRAVRNVALSIYWLEDNSSYVVLEAPRRDMPLEFNVFEEAQTMLTAALKSLGYPADTQIKLDELSASYRIEVRSPTKLTQKDVLDRVAFFSPFLEASTYQDKSKVNLKWKAVNNYEQEGAVYSYLTKRILEDDVELDDEASARVRQYVAGIMEEFGRSEADAKRLFDDWFRRRTEVTTTGTDPVSAHNTGVEIEITLSHPIYFVSFVGIDSEKTFNRLISVVTAFFYYTPSTHVKAVVEVPQAPVVNKVVAPVAVAAAAKPDMRGWMDLLGDDEEEEEEEETVVAKAVAPVPVQAALAPGDARKVTLEPLKEWWKTQLDLYDSKLFGYSQTDKTVTVYSRTCQSSSARQPNVMVAEQLDTLVKEYGDAVEWVFLPPPENIILDVYALSNKDLIQEMTTRGFKDILDEAGKPKKKAVLQQIFEDALCAEPTVQGQFCRILRKKEKAAPNDKPIWFVARAGSNPEKPNYYICAEFWCVRDMRPIIPSEFRGTKTRGGQTKQANSCPFCGGTILEDVKHPKQGQTVIKRKEKPGKGEIHEIAGYMDNIHPQKFALPCCFTRPTVTQIKPSEGTQPLPADKRHAADVVEEEPPAQQQEEAHQVEPDTDVNEELTKVLRTIRTQYVLKYEKRQLEPGRIGLCPPGLDEILGQVGTQSVMKSVGVAQHFKPSAKVFVRFGLGNRGARPGLNFLELLGFYLGNLQIAGRPAVKGAKFDTPTVLTPHAVLRQLFPLEPTKEDAKFQLNLRRAFERANYGNLVHEFAGSASALEQGEIQKFANFMGFNLKTENQHMRAHVVRLANAWHNFVNYVHDENAPKEMSHFEHLFACPGVIFPNGLLLVIFEGLTDEEGNQTVRIRCPDYGVSEFSQKYKSPVSFLWHDTVTNAYEPLMYIEGVEEKDKKGKQQYLTFPTIHPESSKFGQISHEIQDSLRDFMRQYLSYVEGCGRYSSPSHPWMLDQTSQLVPKISELLSLKTPDLEPSAVLRDRSNRLVGLIYKTSGTELFVPALEDGSMGLLLKSVYDVESLPLPPLDTILQCFTDKKCLGKQPGLKPSEILIQGQRYSALRLACGAIVPFMPFPITGAATHPTFTELMKKGAKPIAILPWKEDIRFLKMSQMATDTMDVVPEAVVEEAYQYLRISLSEWLQTDDDDAMKILKQLDALRNSQLPLYELRRRGDILLEPIVHNWIDVSPHKDTLPALSLLRKDCLVQSAEGCAASPMCSVVGTECKIHAGTAAQIPDVKVYFTNRIIDEIMRHPSKSDEILDGKVSKISSPMGLVRDKDEILTAESKISELSAELELDYVPQNKYSAGLSYPEDVHDELMGRPEKPERIELPTEWKKVGLHRLPADPAIEDRFITSITAATGLRYKQIEQSVKLERKKKGLKQEAKLQWNDVDWWCLARAIDTNIIITRYNTEVETSRPYKWFKGLKQDAYLVVFVTDGPEMLQSQKNPLSKDALPKSMETFLDSSYAINFDAAKESV